MILTLSPSRFDDLLTPDQARLDPPVPAHTYHDNSGNFCHVIRAPAGRFTMSTDFLVKDSGEPDAVAPGAQQHALEDLPKTCRWRSWSICSVAATARPIAYRIRHGHSLVSFRRVGRWCRRSATTSTIASRSVTSTRARPKQHGTPIPTRRVPRLCPPCHHAVPLHECSCAILHRLSGGHRRAARRFTDGFQRLVRSLYRWPLVHVTTSRASVAS